MIALLATAALALSAPPITQTATQVRCDGTVLQCDQRPLVIARAEAATPRLPALPANGWGGMILDVPHSRISCAVAYTSRYVSYACGIFENRRPGDLLWRVRWRVELPAATVE